MKSAKARESLLLMQLQHFSWVVLVLQLPPLLAMVFLYFDISIRRLLVPPFCPLRLLQHSLQEETDQVQATLRLL